MGGGEGESKDRTGHGRKEGMIAKGRCKLRGFGQENTRFVELR